MTVHENQQPSLHDALQRFVETADTTPPDAEAVVQSARKAVSELLAHVDALESDLARLRLQQERLGVAERQLADAEQLVGSERELRLEIESLRSRNDELSAVLDKLYRSTSWKVTQPIRKAAEMARETAVDAVRQFRGK
jgi:uncharacterized coiled-coil DUF342 family protein